MILKLFAELQWHYWRAGAMLLVGAGLAALASAIFASPFALLGEGWFRLAALALFPFFLGGLVLSESFGDMIGKEERERMKAIRMEMRQRKVERLVRKARR